MGSDYLFSDEVKLVAEVADTTLEKDTQLKADLYARLGIPEYWVIDLNGRTVIQHRQPDTTTGRWGMTQEYGENDEVSPQTAQESKVRVADLLT